MTISSIGKPAATALPESRPVLQGVPTASPPGAEPARERAGAEDFGLKVLRSEIREVLSSRLKLKFTSNGYESRVSAKQVARESLSAATYLLRQSPLGAADDLRRLRSDVESAGEGARRLLSPDERGNIGDALSTIDRGLADLGADAARNRQSSASVLDADAKLKQRSTIRIRTQDGDVVTLRLRQREALSVEAASKDGASFIELESSSRSRLDLRVRGDLDAGELEAIRAVFDRASEIAGSFFGGDLAAAFEQAAALEFDRTELAQVRLKFRSAMESRIRYAEAVPYPVLESAEPAGPSSSKPAADTAAPATAEPVKPVVEQASEPVVAAAPVATEAPAAPADAPPTADDAGDAVSAFVVQVKSFLQSTTLGFEKADGQRYFYSESFKLTLLKSVLLTAAPEGSEEAAKRASTVVDALAADERDDD